MIAQLIKELVPHAPQMGLYVAPQIPDNKLRNALNDYAATIAAEDVLALYDATLLGSAKDGAVFTQDRFVFQNNDLEPAQEVSYGDIVRVEMKRKMMGGRKVYVDVNRGRATFNLVLDFSAKKEAADYIARFLHEAFIRGAAVEMDHSASSAETNQKQTDVNIVRLALEDLSARGLLSESDRKRMMTALDDGTRDT